MSRTRGASSSPNRVSATCRALRSSSRPPSASSSSLICIDRAGCEMEQASAARPKWLWRASASKYRSWRIVTLTTIRKSYRSDH
ncbi:hypothetical protein ACVWXO_002630 [Bradyrhizobium sp. LM2.7]